MKAWDVEMGTTSLKGAVSAWKKEFVFLVMLGKIDWPFEKPKDGWLQPSYISLR